MSLTGTIKARLFLAFAAIAFLTAVNAGLGLFFTNSVGNRGLQIGERLSPLVDAANKIQVNAARAHLLLEEIVSGDDGEDINEVWQYLVKSLWYADAILEGGADATGRYYPSESPEVRAKISAVRHAIAEFLAVARQRYDQYVSHAAAGSAADAEFDGLYKEIIAALSEIGATASGDGANDFAVLRNSGDAKFLLANGHLFLEEILAGDAEESFADVVGDFEAAKASILQLRGARSAAEIDRIARKIDDFVGLASQRHDTIQTGTAAGGEYDARVDASFEAFVAATEEAVALIRADIEGQLAEARTYEANALLVLGGVSLLVLLVASVMGYRLSRSVTRRVGTLSAEIEALSRGYPGAQNPFVEDLDEIGTPARTLPGSAPRAFSPPAARRRSAAPAPAS